MKRMHNDDRYITVRDLLQVSDLGMASVFHVTLGSAAEIFQPGSVWENEERREFVVQKVSESSESQDDTYDRLFVAFDPIDGEVPPGKGEKLHPAKWKYEREAPLGRSRAGDSC